MVERPWADLDSLVLVKIFSKAAHPFTVCEDRSLSQQQDICRIGRQVCKAWHRVLGPPIRAIVGVKELQHLPSVLPGLRSLHVVKSPVGLGVGTLGLGLGLDHLVSLTLHTEHIPEGILLGLRGGHLQRLALRAETVDILPAAVLELPSLQELQVYPAGGQPRSAGDVTPGAAGPPATACAPGPPACAPSLRRLELFCARGVPPQLKHMTALQVLRLPGLELGYQASGQFLSAAKHRSNARVFAAAVGQLPQLRELYLQECSMFRAYFIPDDVTAEAMDEALAPLSQLTSLQVLDISRNGLMRRLPTFLSGLTSLLSLDLGELSPGMTQAGLAPAVKLESLMELWIDPPSALTLRIAALTAPSAAKLVLPRGLQQIMDRHQLRNGGAATRMKNQRQRVACPRSELEQEYEQYGFPPIKACQ